LTVIIPDTGSKSDLSSKVCTLFENDAVKEIGVLEKVCTLSATTL
jgi:hypothetical protein